ncbi:hypothetical protein HY640_02075 [Candidatus Woesearchaeota archaeon]|nr:hypothetical protein [Candidatus Woesearchaeota archaeon]
MAKGYFFTLDAFIAAGIIVVALFFVASSNTATVTVPYASFISSDTLLYLSSTKMVQVDNSMVNSLLRTSLYNDTGGINNETALQSTILQGLGILIMMDGENGGTGSGGPNDYVQKGREMLNLTLGGFANRYGEAIPVQYGLEVRVNDTVFFSRNASSGSRRIVVASKSIVVGTYNGSMWGPFPVEVVAWE